MLRSENTIKQFRLLLELKIIELHLHLCLCDEMGIWCELLNRQANNNKTKNRRQTIEHILRVHLFVNSVYCSRTSCYLQMVRNNRTTKRHLSSSHHPRSATLMFPEQSVNNTFDEPTPESFHSIQYGVRAYNTNTDRNWACWISNQINRTGN